jgi:hypothetical protein
MVIAIAVMMVLFFYAVIDILKKRSNDDLISNGNGRLLLSRDEITTGSICEICLKTISKEQGSVECRCGALFHNLCGKREAVCPECGREIMT